MRISVLSTLFLVILGVDSLTPATAQEDLIYVTVETCRLVDTRKAGGAIATDSTRNFLVSGTVAEQGGNTAGCQAPRQGVEPLAISAYVLAVPATGSTAGVLTAYPSDRLPPPVGTGSTVNFAAGQIIGNTTNITLCDSGTCPTDGKFAILARNTNQHVVVDVQGYFYPATPGTCPASTATRFVDNGDGTICDSQTGLMWEMKDAADGVVNFDNPNDVDNVYFWSAADDDDDSNPDGTVFTDFLARLNNTVASSESDIPFAGHTDWRIPTISELQTIVDCSAGSLCIDPLSGPTAASFYWSSTSFAKGLFTAWVVHFDSGFVFNVSKAFNYRVRAVRGGR